MQIVVTVERIRYANPDSRWYLFRGTMGGDGQPETSVTCKGTLNWQPNEMETLALTGEYVVYKGERQFQFKAAKLTLPLEPRSQLHYVCMRSHGVGIATEQQIWDLMREDWRNLPFGSIRKMTPAAFDSFQKQIELFDDNHERAEVVSWLIDKGATDAMANAAYEKWGAETTGVVNENCYKLADLAGFSFKTVDENIRQNFEIGDDDARRVKAAVLYGIQLVTDDGSTAMSCWAHFEAVQKLIPNVGDALIVQCVQEMQEAGELYVFRDLNMMAGRRDYMNETIVADYVRLAVSNPAEEIPLTDEELAAGEPFTPDESQISAVRHAIGRKFCIVNGGAGVGKTTVIRMIVRGMKAAFKNLDVALCAPTGKAAARLKEASGIPATTIHVMLGSKGADVFTAGTLERVAIIIDEASMVDSALLAEITKRNPARLVLVGDQAQLTPVGRGQPFHDIIELYPDTVRTLTKCYRNTEAVFQAASKIRNGNLPPRFMESERERWSVVGHTEPKDAHEAICAWAKDGILDFEKDIVLCPKNGKKIDGVFQEATVNALNEDLLALDRWKRGKTDAGKFLAGDRVINTVNMAEEHVWNGTTGTVLTTDDDGSVFVKLDVPFQDENGETKDQVRFTREMAKNLTYAYALTVHKSQGSQYRKVVIVLLARDKFQLDRSLIYTAATRTKEECVIVGDYQALAAGISQIRTKKTCLQLIQKETAKK